MYASIKVIKTKYLNFGGIIKNQFVDLFKFKEYGFNYFPILGIIVASCLYGVIFNIYHIIIRGRLISGDITLSTIFYAILYYSCFVIILHLVKRDIILPIATSIHIFLSV